MSDRTFDEPIPRSLCIHCRHQPVAQGVEERPPWRSPGRRMVLGWSEGAQAGDGETRQKGDFAPGFAKGEARSKSLIFRKVLKAVRIASTVV